MANRTVLAALVALATVTGVAAQTTTSDPVEGQPIQKNNLQVTGTVVSSDENRLIVRGDNGQQMTFIVNEQTTDPKLFNVGDRVTASYVTLAGTGPVVTKVVSSPVMAESKSTGTVIYPPAATATTTVTTPTPSASATATVTTPAPTTTTVADTDVDTDVDTDMDTDDDVATLPATASPLPLVALFGLLAAGGAGVARRFGRKS
jgi:hypothetical protein